MFEGNPVNVDNDLRRDENENSVQIDLQESDARQFVISKFKTQYNLEKSFLV